MGGEARMVLQHGLGGEGFPHGCIWKCGGEVFLAVTMTLGHYLHLRGAETLCRIVLYGGKLFCLQCQHHPVERPQVTLAVV